MGGLILDLRHALAVYRATPFASVIAVVAFAASMACVTAFLSMWSDLSLKPPPGFESGRRLVTIGQSGGYRSADSSSPLTLDLVEAIDEAVTSLEFIAGVASFPQVLHVDGTQETIQVEAVTRHFSDSRPRMQLGRAFREEDHRSDAEPVVIVSHRLWQELFGGRGGIVGETVRITGAMANGFLSSSGSNTLSAQGQEYRIVGVMSPRMRGTFVDTTDVWLPYEQVVPLLFGPEDSGAAIELGVTSTLGSEGERQAIPTRMRGLAWRRDGAGVAAIENELNARFDIESQALAPGFVVSGEEMRFDVIEGVVRNIGVQRESRRQIRLFLGGTLLLAVIAVCNISLFILARARRRQRELGIRMAVGASVRRLAQQLTSEAGLLVVVATILGVVASAWLSVVLRDLPFLQQAEWRAVSTVDWRVLGVLVGVAFVLTALAAIAPILGLRSVGISASSALVTARAGPAQRIVGTVQIALTGVVSAVAAAFLWHLVFYAMVDRGFDARDVLVVEVERLPTTPGALNLAVDNVVERERRRDIVAGLPGVDEASFASYAPGGAGSIRLTMIQRESGEYAEYGTIYTDAYYTDVLDIPIAVGSSLDPDDRMQILGNQSYALDRFGRIDAAGEVTTTGYTLQGVMRDASFRHPASGVMAMALSSWPQGHYPLLLVETPMSPAELSGMLKTRIDAGELEIAVRNITPLSRFISRDLRDDRVRAILTASAALLVVTLAVLGFYGMQRYLVTAGQREYAIRVGLGAGPRALGMLVMRRSVGLALPGLVAGSLLAFVVVLWLRDGFVTADVSAGAISLIVLAAIVLLVVAATVGPALQATRMTPSFLLKEP